ncbi:MAG: SGNH/GDSL hydrolase family protein, partial [Bacteroidota bacterium]|nr:SGNH/GDSL hydrolase family protein [Bacteroidota bacterium]
VFAEHGHVTRPTQHQRHKGTTIFNGNRFLVIIPKGTIPDIIQVPDPKHPGKLYDVSTGYKGKVRFCARCQQKHLGTCEYLTKFYAEKDVKKAVQIKTKIISDSMLRQADDTGLSADIICMSGGRIGNVSHVIIDEPSMSTMDDVIVVAGVNDINCDDETLEQFVSTVGKGVGQLQHNVFASKINLTLVAPSIPDDSPELRKDKLDEFNSLIAEFLERNKDATPFKYVQPAPINMVGIHPTQKGTVDILRAIHGAVPIIRNEEFISDKKLYRGVTSIFKYGCLYCTNYLEVNDASICHACSLPPKDDDSMADGVANKNKFANLDNKEADQENKEGNTTDDKEKKPPKATPTKEQIDEVLNAIHPVDGRKRKSDTKLGTKGDSPIGKVKKSPKQKKNPNGKP